ncbi:MAG: DUF2080 family transposase-associated protein [Thermodesulfobacteriota bacterium]
MSTEEKPIRPLRALEPQAEATGDRPSGRTKFDGYGEEMIEKKVRKSGNSGRIYLPPEWVGKNVKIIRLD